MSHREIIENNIEKRSEDYKGIALAIHDKPEVSNYEFFASETLANKLQEEGFEVKLDVAGKFGYTERLVKRAEKMVVRKEVL